MIPLVHKLLDLFSDKLKSGQRFKNRHTETFTNTIGQTGGYNALNSRAVFRQFSGSFETGENIVQKYASDLVAA